MGRLARWWPPAAAGFIGRMWRHVMCRVNGRAKDGRRDLVPIMVEEGGATPALICSGVEGPASASVDARREIVAARTPGDQEQEGRWVNLRDVLDRMDSCHAAMTEMRRFARDVYEYHSRVGAIVFPTATLFRDGEFEFDGPPPASGSLFFDGDRRIGTNTFVCFERVEPGPDVEATHDEVFCVTLASSLVDRPRIGAACRYYVAVDRHRRVRVLRERRVVRQRLPASRKRGARRCEAVVLSRGLGWGESPSALAFYGGATERSLPYRQWAALAFYAAANGMYQAAADLLVRARKNGVAVALGVDLRRTPYFFRDRETTLATDGRRKRIFHAVEAHERVLGDGRTVQVRAHYRGERRFGWHGYAVTVSVPGVHHPDLRAAGPMRSVELPAGEPIPPGLLAPAQAGELIAEILEA